MELLYSRTVSFSAECETGGVAGVQTLPWSQVHLEGGLFKERALFEALSGPVPI